MSDTFVKEKLVLFNLECLTQSFAENKIDESVWLSLKSDEILKDLIPQVGLRIKFQQQFSLDQIDIVCEEYIKCSPGNSLGTPSANTSSASTLSLVPEDTKIITDDIITAQCETGNNIGRFTLKDLLETSPKGKYIIGFYSIKKKLDDDSRNKLSEIIIEHELSQDPDKRLSRQDFNNLSLEIVQTFPGECKDIYFRVAVKRTQSGKWKKDGQGKLFAKYYNIRKSLKKVGLIGGEGNEDIALHENDDDDETSKESLCWLKNNVEPWGQVEQFWTKTIRVRQNELKDTPIYKYYTTYRVLRENRGFTLLENDFNILYPQYEMNFYANWPEFCEKVLANSRNCKDKNIQHYLSMHSKITDEDCKAFIVLKILPNLLRSQTVTKIYKPSKEEVQQAFILHIKRIDDIQKTLEERKEKLQRHGLTFQPTAIVVGTSEEEINDCFVAVDQTLYNVCTPLKAVELCFKVIHALNAQYPPEAEHIWMCIQKGIFKMTTKYDKTYTSVSQFLGN